MELVTDAAGDPAPRLGEVDLSPETAREYHRFLIQQIVCMLSIGLIHGDLSEFNVLIGSEGPVIIDLPQAVNAAGNRMPGRKRCDESWDERVKAPGAEAATGGPQRALLTHGLTRHEYLAASRPS